MHWKKAIAAGALGALMAGSTLGFAQSLDDFPAPFVVGANVNALVVVGATAATADVAGAIDVAARLGGASVTKETVSVPGVSGVAQIIGEGREIGTKSQPIFLGTNLARSGLRTTMTDSDLPGLLASGTVEDTDANDEYDFDQFVQFSNDFELEYSRVSGEESDPSYKFGEFGTSASTTNNFYKAQVVFTDEVNMNTVRNEDIEIFGGKYTFAPDTSTTCTGTSSQIVFFGAAETRLLREGESVTVSIGGATHTVALLVVSDADTVAVTVDGTSKSLDKGQSTTISGVSVFIDDVFFSSKEAVASSAEIGIGAREITMQDGTQVEVGIGGDTDFIDGSLVDITCSSGNLTKLDVYVTAADSKGDFLAEGGAFIDPVFGTFSVAFPTVLPSSDAGGRDVIEINPSGDNDGDVIFTNDRGDKATVEFVHSTNSASADGDLILSDDNSDEIIVVEGQFVDRDDYFVTDAGDFARMFEVTGASSLATASAEVRIRDVFGGDTIEIDLGADNAAEKVIDGQSYFFNVTGPDADNLNLLVTWGDSSSTEALAAVINGAIPRADVGTYQTVYPKLKTKLDGEIAFMEQVSLNLTQGTAHLLQLPTGAVGAVVNADASSVTFTANTTDDSESSSITTVSGSGNNTALRVGKTSTGGSVYNFTWVDQGTTGTLTVSPAAANGEGITDPTVLLVEEEDDDGDVGTVQVTAGWDNGDDETTMGAPVIANVGGASSSSGTREGDTDVTWYVDEWGTWVSRDTEDQAELEIRYPDEQVSAVVALLGEDGSVSTAGGSAATTITTDRVSPIKSSIAKLDTQVTDADKANKNLLLVGGPAVNSLVADLATQGKTWARDMYIQEGAGTAILQVVSDAFAAGRVALIAAGHSADDTRAATSILQKYDDFAALTGDGVKIKNGVITGAL
jgi:hypothetical protein